MCMLQERFNHLVNVVIKPSIKANLLPTTFNAKAKARLKDHFETHNELIGDQPRMITVLQIDYVSAYLANGGDKWKAYHSAGYKSLHGVNPRYARRSIHNVHHANGVQWMLRSLMADAMKEATLSATDFVSMILKAYNDADTVKDQLKALELLTRVAPITSGVG